jgi:ubiquitin-protein ligase
MSTFHGRIHSDFFKACKAFQNSNIYINRPENDPTKVYFVLTKIEDPRYKDGYYFCLLHLDKNHPHHPPSFYIFNNNGRFQVYSEKDIDNNKGICFTYTKWHSNDWTPIHNIESLIISFISFFLQDIDDNNKEHQGSILTTDEQKTKYAYASPKELIENNKFIELFSDTLLEEINKAIKDRSLTTKTVSN